MCAQEYYPLLFKFTQVVTTADSLQQIQFNLLTQKYATTTITITITITITTTTTTTTTTMVIN